MRQLVAGVACVACVALVAGTAVAAPPATYDLTPFADSHPTLVQAHTALASKKTPQALLAAAYAALPLPTGDAADPVATSTAHWLGAQLQTRLGAAPDSHYTHLANDLDGAFRDEALAWLAQRAMRRGDKYLAAEHWLARHPTARDYRKGALKAASVAKKRLRRAKTNAAISALEAALEQALTVPDRRALTLALAKAYWSHKRKTDARTVLHQLWWATGDKTVRKQLKRYKLSLGWASTEARAALVDTKASLASTQKRFDRMRAKKGLRYGLKRWGMTVTRMRRTETATLGSVRKIRSVRKTLEKHRSLRPLVSYALGLAQQGRGEYTTALARYERVFKKSPRHPIAVTAAAQKRRLLTKVDRDVEALAVDAWLVDWAPFGRVHRDALWRVGFDAVMRGDEAAAEQHLARLAHGYGHQRAGTGLIWEAQAGYWLARNADLAGKTTLANARYTTLTQRFPGTWYGRLARQRLGPEAPSSVDPTAIPRAAGLDTVIAYARLGERAEAKQQLWQLRRQGFFRLLGPRVRDAIKPPEPPAVVVTADPSEPAIERSPEQVDAPPQKTPIEPTTPFETHRVALEAAAQEHAVDPTLIAAIAHIETRFRPDAVSRAGAMGMCQLMPATGEAHGKKLYGPDFSADRLTEPEVNFRIAAYHLARVRELVGEHPVMLLAAYNAGRARAVRWHAAFGALPVDAFVERIPFPQARRYVQTVVTAAETMRRTHWPSRLSTAVPLALTPLP